jgi:PQQ-dependent catabolism-associated CXXCW motif protein
VVGRILNYRAPTPATLKGARVVTTAEAEQIWKSGGAVFLDVLPHAPRPANLPPGTIWREKPRRNIPGSSWLPDTGYGALAPMTENYLRTNLARATGGDRTKALVVYGLRDCWMSWNAAKRILAMGYANVRRGSALFLGGGKHTPLACPKPQDLARLDDLRIVPAGVGDPQFPVLFARETL